MMQHEQNNEELEFKFCKTFNCIYMLTCGVCGFKYIGQTSGAMNLRINQHRSDIGKNTSTKNIGRIEIQHFNKHGFEDVTLNIIKIVPNKINRLKMLKSSSSVGEGAPDILSSIVDNKELKLSNRYGRHIPLTKKQGVSGESASYHDGEDFQVQKYEKDFKSKQLIKDAIMENDFLKNLDASQVIEIVDCMYCQYFTKGTQVIKEGDVGSHLYVSAGK
ncbi:cGMP-dependent protein kinase, isozyme 1 [Trichonephila clavipes]|nr:cGMP-dependent protein kinase, isozyme 1 [Trichonephila clavipes]